MSETTMPPWAQELAQRIGNIEQAITILAEAESDDDDADEGAENGNAPGDAGGATLASARLSRPPTADAPQVHGRQLDRANIVAIASAHRRAWWRKGHPL